MGKGSRCVESRGMGTPVSVARGREMVKQIGFELLLKQELHFQLVGEMVEVGEGLGLTEEGLGVEARVGKMGLIVVLGIG